MRDLFYDGSILDSGDTYIDMNSPHKTSLILPKYLSFLILFGPSGSYFILIFQVESLESQ